MEEKNYLSVTEFAEKYKKDPADVRRLIYNKRIPAIKIGNQWAIPADTEPPPDKRVKSGKYRNWRKPKNQNQNKKSSDSPDDNP